MIICVASGKGGTGKTFVATNLAHALAKQGAAVSYFDGDVENPNGHLFLNPRISNGSPATVTVPFLTGYACEGCGNCQTVCAFNAIINVNRTAIVFNELCHGCGACVLSCKANNLLEKQRIIGEFKEGTAGKISFSSGTLNIGEARSAPIVKQLVSRASVESKTKGFMLLDSPPGTSCSAMAAMEKADLVLLVTEPTRLGLHDFKLAVQLARALEKPIAAIVNRADLGSIDIFQYIEEQGIPLIANIKFCESVARCGAAGELAIEHDKDIMIGMLRVANWLKREEEKYG